MIEYLSKLAVSIHGRSQLTVLVELLSCLHLTFLLQGGDSRCILRFKSQNWQTRHNIQIVTSETENVIHYIFQNLINV